MAATPRPPGLVPVHIGLPAPEHTSADAPVTSPAGAAAQRQSASVSALAAVAWEKHGAEPRWLAKESSDCAAALNPSIFASRGANELKRFLAGATDRRETALIVCSMGRAEDDAPASALSSYDASVEFPGFQGLAL